ncbi:MAG: HDIG domain-containing protein [Bacteroidales bacterium]|nr:HDIG domain-containing protein [Bacteroidales bacterium]
MSKTYIQKGELWHLVGRRLWLIALTTAIIVMVLPHSGVPQFDYELNHPWQYDQLIAKSETPLYKSEEVLKRERDSLHKTFEPYYNVSVTVRERALQRFSKKFGNGIPGLPTGYASYVAKRIRKVYDLGIISADIYSKSQTDSTLSIRLVSGNTATSILVNGLKSPLTAYEWLFDDPLMQSHRNALQQCNLNEFLEPNIILDQERTQMEEDDLMSSIPVASGMIQVGEKIIDRGEVVDERAYTAITSYLRDLEKCTTSEQELLTTYGGQALYVSIIILLFTLYLILYRKDYFDNARATAMLYIVIVLLPALVSFVMQHHFFTVYVLPLCMAPLFIRVFMDSRTAFLTHTVIVLLSAIAVQKQFDFIVIQEVGGLVAIFTLRELTRRSQIFIAAFTVSLVEITAFFALQLIQATNFTDFDTHTTYHFIGNGILLLLSYPMMFVVEKAFGFVSAVTLFELSDTNKGILRRLSEVAPGTFQHSITVGNLAAEIASKIGAKSLLVRVGALYHDIGKMRHPVFFTENQVGINPHKRISETESAQVVISHVTEGLRMAEKENLPGVILDFIRTHHGAGMTRFFYVQYKNNHPDEEVDDELFTYPGPNPFTPEQAILMMADTVEAASRSLQEYTEESIASLVNRLIDSQVQQGFFHDCPITFRDIQTAKDVLTERLKSIYHTRIAYPELNKR